MCETTQNVQSEIHDSTNEKKMFSQVSCDKLRFYEEISISSSSLSELTAITSLLIYKHFIILIRIEIIWLAASEIQVMPCFLEGSENQGNKLAYA